MTDEEKRFKAYEVIGDQSVKLIHDTKHDIDLTIEKIESKLNYFDEAYQKVKDEVYDLQEDRRLLWNLVDGFMAYEKLREKGYFD